MLKVFQRFLSVDIQRNCACNLIASKVLLRMASSSKPALQDATTIKVRNNPALMKINTPEFCSIFTEELNTLIDIFNKYNYELRIAGGAVRDIVMNIEPKDIDLATTATPDEMKDLFAKEQVRLINANGEKHGTITPRINDKENFEITTLRIDVITDGRRAQVQFTRDWQLDANRRDLTINSMFLGFDGTLYDYFFGYEDLQKRRIVFVGDADTRIKEDYLRILRYFRFYGRIAKEANNHDIATLQAICSNADGLARISGERIWSEMQKICIGNFGEELLLEMIQCGLFPYCGLPEVPNVEELKRLCRDLQNFPGQNYPIIYLIALLNSYTDAIQLHERLKLSAFERDMAFFITQQRNKVGKEYKTLLDYQKLCLTVKREFVEELLKYCNKRDYYDSLRAWKKPIFPLNGSLLMDHGCPPNKKMGVIMSQLQLIWADSHFQLSSEDLLKNFYPALLEKISETPPQSPKKKVRKS